MKIVISIIVCLFILLAYRTYVSYFPPIPKRKKKYTYALLLGCPTHDDGTLCTSQMKRCQLAIDTYKQGMYDTLIITGGAVKNQYIESESMKEEIVKHIQMPIQTETKSRNTFENFTFSKEIIQDQDVLILTSQTHARRACAIAKQFFSEYSAAWYPEHRIKHVCREIASRILYIRIEQKKKRGTYQ